MKANYLSLVLIAGLAGCDSAKPTPTPAPVDSGAHRQDMGEDAVGEEDEDGDSRAQLTFVTGGAKVGDSGTRDEVKKCHEEKKFYDRFTTDSGSCSDIELARVDCTLKGVRKILSAKQREQFDEAIEGSYKGWLLDQCADCSSDSDSKLCESPSGDKQEGTKLFFVKESGEEGEGLSGKNLVAPVRPGHSKDKAKAKTKAKSKSDDSDE